MAEQHGKTGAIYSPTASVSGKTLSFQASDDTIHDSQLRLASAGFTSGMKIEVYGSTSNDGVWTLSAAAPQAGYMTVTGSLTDEIAGNEITIATVAPGTLSAGFFNWNLTATIEAKECTDFADAGVSTYIVGKSGWTATAERNWHDDFNPDNSGWQNAVRMIRFYVKYVASPTVGNPAYYYEGMALTNSQNTNTPNDDVVKQTINFQGVGNLRLVTRTTSWD